MRKKSLSIVIGVLLLLLLWWLWSFRHPTAVPAPVTPPTPVSVSTAPVITPPTSPAPVKSQHKGTEPAKSASPLASGPTAPPPIQLHQELIPKDITIVRCYYDQEIMAPGVTIGFDVNGSGFTKEFETMIKVDPSAKGIQVKNPRLVTANQIHGEFVVGNEVSTQLVYPQILIKNLPVFRAPDPFAVIRKGEVLTLVFINMDPSGRAGRFRVFTNLDDALYKDFHVEPSTVGLQVSDLEPHLPFVIEGTLRIGPGVGQGNYGLSAFLGSKKIFSKDDIIRIVHPNLGATGLIHSALPIEPYHRPGDNLEFYLQGTGLSPADVPLLTAHVEGYEMGQASFTYVSTSQIRFSFQIPPAAPLGKYGIAVFGQNNTQLYEKKDIVTLVPANWIAGIQISPPVSPGQKSSIRLIGRDLSADFAKSLKTELDDPGIHISPFVPMDPSTLAADIVVDAAVAPGDYLLTLTSNGQPVKPQFGNLIKVNPR